MARAMGTLGAFALAVGMGVELLRTDSTPELRRKLIQPNAKGIVLETCAGGAKNLTSYDFARVNELVLVDRKVDDALARIVRNPQTRVVECDNLDEFADESFDTVVDTHGVCALEHPKEYLAQMRRVLKPEGKALFLEHGRAETYSLTGSVVNSVLDLFAPLHFKQLGCHCNRSITTLVEEAGFHVDQRNTHLFGTNTVIVASKQ